MRRAILLLILLPFAARADQPLVSAASLVAVTTPPTVGLQSSIAGSAHGALVVWNELNAEGRLRV
jgi:hypothetical protein